MGLIASLFSKKKTKVYVEASPPDIISPEGQLPSSQTSSQVQSRIPTASTHPRPFGERSSPSPSSDSDSEIDLDIDME